MSILQVLLVQVKHLQQLCLLVQKIADGKYMQMIK